MGIVISFFSKWGDNKMSLSDKVYNVMDIAKYVINRSIDIGTPVSNLKLQKILYFIQGEFLSTLKKPAFKEEIEAWRHGPVVPEVYYEFNKYIANDIISKFDRIDETIFETNDCNVINKVIKDNSDKSAWSLVQITHNQSPWIDNYECGENVVIPIKDIEKCFLKLDKSSERKK